MTTKNSAKIKKAEPESGTAPRYELRVRKLSAGDQELEIWQLPAHATPHLKEPKRIAGLHGRNLALIEHRLIKQLSKNGVSLTGLKNGEKRRADIGEDEALRLGLLFRMLAPMRSRANMTACATGIEAMGKEEAAYWLGMAMHRKYPRRVLMALRILLIDPKEG
jgi:hypothetical protein